MIIAVNFPIEAIGKKMISRHIHLQSQYKYELFHINFTTITPFLRETRVSRKGIFPLHSVSMVNEMFVSIEFYVSWKADTSYLFQILGETDELLIADSSISPMQRLADRTVPIA